MREIRTEITIYAPVEKVWDVLVDFDSYPDWNPFIRLIEGQVNEGDSFKVKIQPPGSEAMTFKPKCLSFNSRNEFTWLGHLLIPGIFDGEHIFELKHLSGRETLFVQREKFSGLLLPFLWKKLDINTRQGFHEMNLKLKEEVEK